MFRRHVLESGALALASAASLTGCLDRRGGSGESREETLDHDGRTRTARVYLPDGVSTPAPTVLLLHGGGGSPTRIERFSGFRALADREGFVVVTPTGVEKHWNDGRDTDIATAHTEDVDDVGFLAALLDRLAADEVTTPGEVCCTGISNGGMMTLRLAAERPDLLACGASIAANLPAALDVRPTELPMLFVHGDADPLVPYEGGQVGFARNQTGRGRVRSADETVGLWLDANRCAGEPSVTVLDGHEDGTTVEDRRYDCADAPVRHLVIRGGGHGWPGASKLLDPLLGTTTREVDGAELVWAFFASR
ncbi:alpha/beta hydrolase family esterase [Haloarchaeobius sp. DT45]|uniref:alpha/beta hydrolase family esterase n=1 Tax=Haloarchaeobius sp. DT45 TaxID=3446116 RepID=UPI003F6D4545